VCVCVCVLQAGVALPQHGALPYFMYNSDLLGAQPPPAHMRFAPLQFAAHPGRSFQPDQDISPWTPPPGKFPVDSRQSPLFFTWRRTLSPFHHHHHAPIYCIKRSMVNVYKIDRGRSVKVRSMHERR